MEQGNDTYYNKSNKPPALPEIRSNLNFYRDHLLLVGIDRWDIFHLKLIVSSWQSGITHTMLTSLELNPLILVSLHAIKVHALCLAAIIER
ncbi:Uncharacterised protein [Segatella copri]|nr:Uncharacterised protein [Segatella copri]